MTDGNPITIFGDITKPAVALIEKIAEAAGGYYKPYQIRRVAKAEAEAEIISAKAQIEIDALRHRALTRFVAEEAMKQDNIEQITQKAIPELEASSDPRKMENDWITNFFDKCRIVSDEDMQSLWAKVLAGEANSPGTFSRRTVNLLGSLDKSDAELFTNFCGFGWAMDDVYPLIYDSEAPIYNDQGVNFSVLTHLDAIGLISYDEIAGFKRMRFGKKARLHYYGKPAILEFKKTEENDLATGKALLTQTGRQLAPICDAKPVEGSFDYVLDNWAKQGVILSSPYPKQGRWQ